MTHAELWATGARQAAIQSVIADINAAPDPKPVPLVLQLCYYLFLCNDMRAAGFFLERARAQHPQNAELLRNLAAVWVRSGQLEQASDILQQALALSPDDPLLYDTLASLSYRLGRFDAASEAGTRALVLKDALQPARDDAWQLPTVAPAEFAAGKANTVAFSLWGDAPRYCQGALDNVAAMPTVYPGWRARFYVDETVPASLLHQLGAASAQVVMQPSAQPLRDKLAWRFGVANDPTVARFLVRDVDSVVSPRERHAVSEWVASGTWFHVMRDWWTHSDLILAGMWGGVAGILPDLGQLLRAYRPPHLETPNIDQWFLRDCVWRYVRTSCLIHDRCFRAAGARPWPDPDPPGDTHVGQNEHARRCEHQGSQP